MHHVLTLIAAAGTLDDSTVAHARAGAGAGAGAPDWLAPGRACDIPLAGAAAPAAVRAAVAAALAGRPVDVAVLPAAGRRKRLLVADMEATVIANEVLDDVARLAGRGGRVAAITARAMAGEIDFAAALRDRVALLAGVDAGTLDRAARGIRPDAGAPALLATMRAHGARTVLVSGGLARFAGDVAGRLGFDAVHANAAAVAGGRLTGELAAPVLDGAGKRAALEREAAAAGLSAADALAVGDGANDLAMIAASGCGVAYRGAPLVAAAADACIRHGDLSALLYLQGYRAEEIVAPGA